MKMKTILTGSLLSFVAASVIYLVVNEAGGRPAESPKLDTAVIQTTQGQTTEPAATTESKVVVDKVVAYYFHGNMRCMTCRAIEANAREAIEAAFAKALKDGRLEWLVVNVDESQNEHYVADFGLSSSSVVLERVAGGKRQEWKNLDRVWELVRDKKSFTDYVQGEMKAYLEATGK